MRDMQASSAATTALMTVAMMVAMMLPSIAPTLWRYHRDLRAARLPRAGHRATLFGAAYVSVWVAIGLALFAVSSELPARFSPWVTCSVVLCAGALQRSRWKARRLLRCRQACPSARAEWKATTPWRDGCRLGVDCCLSCAAPMAVLLVAGLMDPRVMVLVTAAITAERVAPGGVRIARLTGVLAQVTGLVMCVLAIAGAMAPGT